MGSVTESGGNAGGDGGSGGVIGGGGLCTRKQVLDPASAGGWNALSQKAMFPPLVTQPTKPEMNVYSHRAASLAKASGTSCSAGLHRASVKQLADTGGGGGETGGGDVGGTGGLMGGQRQR